MINKTRPETEELIKLFSRMTVGDIITYATITALIKTPAQEPTGRGLINTARKTVMQDNIVLECVQNVGYVRIENDDTIRYGETWVRKTRNACRRGQKVTSAVDYEKLSEAAKMKHNTNMSVFGAVALFTKPTNIKKIGQGVIDKKTELSLEKDVLKLFS